MCQILIVDDDPTMRLTLSRSLKKQGYEVFVATNGEEGLKEALRLRPALIVCDWMMPMMDGLEVCRHVKTEDTLANTYFILLTARDQVVDIVQGLENGADDFLSKPPDLNELKARVRAGLRLYQANHALQVQKQYLEAELAQAAAYVRSLLPHPLEGQIATRSCFLPSAQLGGDCFDYYWLDRDRLVFYLLDVAGHGVGAALLSVSVLNLLRTSGQKGSAQILGSTDLSQPHEVLSALNDYFQMSGHQDMYFTIWYGVYNKSNQQLAYSSGGHPPAILVNNSNDSPDGKEIVKLKTSGLPIGMISDVEFETKICNIPPGSKLYLFSDGAYEIAQADDSLWGLDSLIDALISPVGQGENSLDIALHKATLTAKHGDKLEDDLSLLELSFA
ncbi:PP2C family protein-serine/threonine phosphatase [Pseudanabaena sp. PCC 6802]|uniref:PP2C family protein-serine/threonine phosphatase n=1 Tax=Pseudanabaena sp. PCC 6802 TaxID=118173 RepID=UPI0003473875|nr:SpoIIE family protein phosphatase [Pseudanabaena sp. PCC 6802]